MSDKKGSGVRNRFIIELAPEHKIALKHIAVDQNTTAAKLAGKFVAQGIAQLQKDKPKK